MSEATTKAAQATELYNRMCERFGPGAPRTQIHEFVGFFLLAMEEFQKMQRTHEEQS